MNFDMKMIAYCGIYCEQCSFRAAVAEQDFKHLEPLPEKYREFREGRSNLSDYACEGCKGRNLCEPCKIKDCALGKGINSCAECGLFPCETLTQFGHDGVPHHQWALENLRNIRENGVDAWFENLRPALRCHCGKRQSWYCVCHEHNSADWGRHNE